MPSWRKVILSGSNASLANVIATTISSSFSGSFQGDGSGLTGVGGQLPANVVSSSLQFNTITSPFTGSFTGSFTGDGSNLTNVSYTTTIVSPIIVSWDGQGGVISTGNPRYRVIPYACTITGWSIVATGTNPTMSFDIWKTGSQATLPTVAGTIMGTKPSLMNANATRSFAVSDWTSSISAGDIICVNIDSCSAALTATFTIEVS